MTRLEPVPQLLRRIKAELSADFRPDRPTRISRAPGRLDVMGGIADYSGSLVCEATIDRGASVALQVRDDRQVQVFSFNLLDEHQPFTLQVPLDALATHSIETLRKDLTEPGRRWAGRLIGCMLMLRERGLIDLKSPSIKGLNLALYSTVPAGVGLGSSAAIAVATMANLLDHFGLRDKVKPIDAAAMCQRVESDVVGLPGGITAAAASVLGEPGTLVRLLCQPHELQPPLPLPAGIRVIGINSAVKRTSGMYSKTRTATFIGHKLILEMIRQMGAKAGREMTGDPMGGYLANLDPDDYKKFFRNVLPEQLKGGEFLLQYGNTIDSASRVEPDTRYRVQGATDHHVLEPRRLRNFVEFLTDAAADGIEAQSRRLLLNKAGHLMYASHLSYTNDALLGSDACDLLVKLVRDREHAGFYGARMTAAGNGGTVAVLANEGPKVDAAIAEILAEYEKQTGHKPEPFLTSTPGAWRAGTAVI